MNQKQREKMADIFAGIAQIYFGSVFLPFVLAVDTFNLWVVVFGLAMASLFWFFSLWLLRKNKP